MRSVDENCTKVLLVSSTRPATQAARGPASSRTMTQVSATQAIAARRGSSVTLKLPKPNNSLARAPAHSVSGGLSR
jgi:hypothetical protein